VLCADQSSAGFQLDLEALDQRHAATGREITLVFDNGSAHCSEVTRAALQARAAWLHVIPLARYCPQLNKKEREWRVLKRDARSHLAHSLREFADDILAGLRRLGGERLDIVDRVPDWFIAGHRRPPRPHLGRPKGAKDPPGWRWPWRQPIVGRPMSELSSVLLVGAGLAAVGTAATWPALRRRVRRRKQPTPPT
jgi:transposase